MALSEEDKIKEQIKFNSEVLKMIGIGIIATTGGTMTIYFERGNDIFTVLGGVFIVVLGTVGISLFLRTLELLK